MKNTNLIKAHQKAAILINKYRDSIDAFNLTPLQLIEEFAVLGEDVANNKIELTIGDLVLIDEINALASSGCDGDVVDIIRDNVIKFLEDEAE